MRWEVRERGSTSFLCLSCTLWSNTFIFCSWGDHKVGPLGSVAYLRHITLRYSVRRMKLTRRHFSWNVNLIVPRGYCWIWLLDYPQICESTNGFTDKQYMWISVFKSLVIVTNMAPMLQSPYAHHRSENVLFLLTCWQCGVCHKRQCILNWLITAKGNKKKKHYKNTNIYIINLKLAMWPWNLQAVKIWPLS